MNLKNYWILHRSQYGSPCPKCRKICYRSQLQPVHLDFMETPDESHNDHKRKCKQKKGTNNDSVDSPKCDPNPEDLRGFHKICYNIGYYAGCIYRSSPQVRLMTLVCSFLFIGIIFIYRNEIITFLVYLLIALAIGIVGCIYQIFRK